MFHCVRFLDQKITILLLVFLLMSTIFLGQSHIQKKFIFFDIISNKTWNNQVPCFRNFSPNVFNKNILRILAFSLFQVFKRFFFLFLLNSLKKKIQSQKKHCKMPAGSFFSCYFLESWNILEIFFISKHYLTLFEFSNVRSLHPRYFLMMHETFLAS